MKLALSLFIILVILTQSRMHVPKKNFSIGNACSGNYYFQVASFNVIPWPPAVGQDLIIEMNGVFGQSVTVSVIGIGQSIGGQSWNYNTVNVYQAFAAGQGYTFSSAIPAGNTPGDYYIQYTLKGPNQMFISCWSFEYQLF